MATAQTIAMITEDSIICRSEAMQHVMALTERVAPSTASVLMTGESGAGKDFVAQIIHTRSPRAAAAFVAVSCPAIPEQLLESELFGHHRGSFTGAVTDRAGLFEHAAGGTLFLDEITEMATGLQAKLLRVLESRRFRRVGGSEEREADFRVIAATNRDPIAAVTEGRLRNDLYYRLNVFRLDIPPLRERRGDIAPLAARFIAMYAAQNGLDVRGLAPAALAALEQYDWPGNVRELRNVIERAVVLARGPEIETRDLPDPLLKSRVPARIDGERTVVEPLADTERRAILSALEHFGHNKSRAARALGISLKTLRSKLKNYARHGGVAVPRA
jgi:transcriptional regulator with PAS, ATPase and Fis domain